MRVAHDSRVFYFNTLHATPKPSRVGFNKHIVRTLWIRNRILESVASKVFQFPSLTDSQFPLNSQFGLVPSSIWFRTQFPSSKFYFQGSMFQVPSSKVLEVWVVLSGDANGRAAASDGCWRFIICCVVQQRPQKGFESASFTRMTTTPDHWSTRFNLCSPCQCQSEGHSGRVG